MNRADAVTLYLALSLWGVLAVVWLVGRINR